MHRIGFGEVGPTAEFSSAKVGGAELLLCVSGQLLLVVLQSTATCDECTSHTDE